MAAVTLAPDQSVSVDLRDAVTQSHPELVGHLGSYGSILFRFNGFATANMFAAAMVKRDGGPIDFHFDGREVNSELNSGGVEGIWWLPAETSNDFLILSNSSQDAVTAELTLSFPSGMVRQLPLSVAPGHTERLNVRDLLGSVLNGMGGISVTYAKGTLSVAQIVYDETAGFAAIMKLFERDLGEKPGSHILRAPMMALSQPDPVLAFPQETRLIPQVLLWNSGAKPVAISPIIDWRNGSASGRFHHPVIRLSSHQSKIIYIDDLQISQQIPSTAMWGTVTLSYVGTTADVVAVALAYDQTNRYGLQTPFSEGTSHLWKGSMWHVDSAHNTLITTGNGGSEPTTAQVTLFYNEAQGRYRIEKVLSPGQQLWLDIGQLIQNQIPDSDGHTLPPETMTGSYELRDVDYQTVGLLYEGKLVIDKTFGHASYGCAACCGYNTTAMSPSSFTGPVGIYNQDLVQAFDGCSGVYDDVTYAAYNWSSANTLVATISQSGNLHTVSVGSTSDNTFVQLESDIVSHNCPEVTKNPVQPLSVQPQISGPNTVWWFNGGARMGYSTSITLTASGGSGYSWSISKGSNMIKLSATSGSSTNVSSTGTAFSSSSTDISVTVTSNGVASNPFYVTSKRPYTLTLGTITYQCDSTWGYDDFFPYTIKDQMGVALPSSVPLNEFWTTGVTDDYTGTNWRRISPGQTTTSSTTPAQFSDEIQGENISLPPVPPTACPSAGRAVEHWGQEWFVGSLTSGSGEAVQTDTIQKNTNDAEVMSIITPVP